VDEDQRSELAPVEPCEDDNDAVEGDFGADVDFGSGRLTFPVAFDLLGRNPKHADAMESIRLAVIRWARRDGLVEEADDVAGEVMLKLALPGELAKARGRVTFKGFVHGYYRNGKRTAIRERDDRRRMVDIADIERIHRDDPTSETDIGAPPRRGDAWLPDTPHLEDDDIEGLSPTLAAAVEALAAAYPRGWAAVRLRCADAGYDEIAAELRISEANARQVHSRAIRFLREYLGGTAR
jgi:RNA polymerase sigma factor (sigma-70 family)